MSDEFGPDPAEQARRLEQQRKEAEQANMLNTSLKNDVPPNAKESRDAEFGKDKARREIDDAKSAESAKKDGVEVSKLGTEVNSDSKERLNNEFGKKDKDDKDDKDEPDESNEADDLRNRRQIDDFNNLSSARNSDSRERNNKEFGSHKSSDDSSAGVSPSVELEKDSKTSRDYPPSGGDGGNDGGDGNDGKGKRDKGVEGSFSSDARKEGDGYLKEQAEIKAHENSLKDVDVNDLTPEEKKDFDKQNKEFDEKHGLNKTESKDSDDKKGVEGSFSSEARDAYEGLKNWFDRGEERNSEAIKSAEKEKSETEKEKADSEDAEKERSESEEKKNLEEEERRKKEEKDK
ncbi:MAG: hypothetical protein IK077_14090 [Thermoguttaceae bacterium]|nr:hypothetical protein [Thermoguttaceae bacterium]